MLGIVILIFVLWTFHKELFFGWILLWLRPRSIGEERYAFALQAEKLALPSLFLFSKRKLKCLSFQHLIRGSLFVNEELWSQLSPEERNALMIWSTCAIRRYPLVSRLIGFAKIEWIDRTCLLYGIQSTTLISLFEKLGEGHPTDFFESALEGLGLTGPSLFFDWPKLNERIQHIGREHSHLANSKD